MSSGWGAYGGAPKPNPFADEQDLNFSNPNSGGAWDIPLRDTDQPAALPQSTAPKANGAAAAAPPAPSSGGSSWFGGKKGVSKEQELAAKEEELKRREAEINAMARKTKNWPWFKPVLYHDISGEVPAWNRGMVRFAYLGWLLGFAGYLVNWLVVMILMFASKKDMGVKNFFICTIATVIGIPMSFFLWYRSLYFASQTDGSVWRYTKTFMYMIIQLAWAAIVIVSPPVIGEYNAGALKMIDMFNKNSSKGYAFGIMCVINLGLWGLSCLIIFFSLGRAVKAMRAGSDPRLAAERRTAGLP